MNYGKALAIVSIIISVAACVGYVVASDYRRAIYWASVGHILRSSNG